MPPTTPPTVNRQRTEGPQAGSRRVGKVMIVDDEPINIKLIQKYLRGVGYQDFVTTTRSTEALDLVRTEQPDILILDVVMPEIDGLQILNAIRKDPVFAHLPVLIVTASTDEGTKISALELGATDFLHKPVKPIELLPRVRNALVVKAHHDQMAAYSKRLENEVAQRTAALKQSRQEVIHVLACAAEYRDHETGNHVIRVGRYSGIIARGLGFNQEDSDLIEQAAILHDVGKIGIADMILLKPGRLTETEFEQMKRHCEYGHRILSARPSDESRALLFRRGSAQSRSPILRTAAVIAMTHHERWDGSGYPNGLAGEEIPIEGRITAVADVFDALSSKRCYKQPLPLDQCLERMLEARGSHFDPNVLDAFLSQFHEIARVAFRLADV